MGANALMGTTGDDESRNPWLARFPLRVEGGKVVDAKGERFRLVGVNWYGASDVEHVVGGLHKRSLRDLASTIAKMGFTVVRLPWSNQLLREGAAVKAGAIDYQLNPELQDKGPLEVLDAVIHALGRCQVAVVPNNHGTFSTWGGEPDLNGIWFCDEPCGHPPHTYTEEQFFADWRDVAKRYKDVPWVVGYDIRNEVRPVPGRPMKWPLWCSDNEAPRGILSRFGMFSYHDWRAVAGRAGREILAECPDKLVVVEQIVHPKQSLEAYLSSPPDGIPTERLVYAVHCYAWGGPGLYLPSFLDAGGWNARGSRRKWLLDFVRTSRLLRQWGGLDDPRCFGEMMPHQQTDWYKALWGWVLERRLAPVWVSELGLSLRADDEERAWFRNLVEYMNSTDADFAYWPINGGPKPSGDSEPYGLLDDNWVPHSEDWRLELLGSQHSESEPSKMKG